jgi:hypothetical protein
MLGKISLLAMQKPLTPTSPPTIIFGVQLGIVTLCFVVLATLLVVIWYAADYARRHDNILELGLWDAIRCWARTRGEHAPIPHPRHRGFVCVLCGESTPSLEEWGGSRYKITNFRRN